jgi:hypothetical protein
MSDVHIKCLVAAPIGRVILPQFGVPCSNGPAFFVEFAGGCVCIGFACIDASRWNFPVCPVYDKAIVFYQ